MKRYRWFGFQIDVQAAHSVEELVLNTFQSWQEENYGKGKGGLVIGTFQFVQCQRVFRIRGNHTYQSMAYYTREQRDTILKELERTLSQFGSVLVTKGPWTENSWRPEYMLVTNVVEQARVRELIKGHGLTILKRHERVVYTVRGNRGEPGTGKRSPERNVFYELDQTAPELKQDLDGLVRQIFAPKGQPAVFTLYQRGEVFVAKYRDE